MTTVQNFLLHHRDNRPIFYLRACYIPRVMLYNMCHVMLYITCVLLCYITYVMLC